MPTDAVAAFLPAKARGEEKVKSEPTDEKMAAEDGVTAATEVTEETAERAKAAERDDLSKQKTKLMSGHEPSGMEGFDELIGGESSGRRGKLRKVWHDATSCIDTLQLPTLASTTCSIGQLSGLLPVGGRNIGRRINGQLKPITPARLAASLLNAASDPNPVFWFDLFNQLEVIPDPNTIPRVPNQVSHEPARNFACRLDRLSSYTLKKYRFFL
ncbi:unnamed protein product [Protopolystoma xenopodis]|uniref:Uncharacterized protein n=1 Tax=Protopolystoma xenopodis TaxID=117903 RepID=A0A448X4T5_9PLAT|nr:unnamed protein product [Protopolystoma xenopodis]